MVHLLTTATLDRLRELYPQGRFEVRRLRPNIVVQLGSSEKSFAENAWVGHTLAIGTAVRLNITSPCGRCVVTTLAQGDLSRDPGILRTAAQLTKSTLVCMLHQVNVGVCAAVERGVMPPQPWRSSRCPRPNSATWSRLFRVSRKRSLNNKDAERLSERAVRAYGSRKSWRPRGQFLFRLMMGSSFVGRSM
jgi:MOSC domain